MNEPSRRVNPWFQPALFGRDVYEITLRIGLVPESEHVQVELEVRECRSDQLVHLESRHHVDAHVASTALAPYFGKMAQFLEDLMGPF